jgi:hypothetical protein
VSKEIAGHISEAMQSHYSIQQHDTKMAALEALEYPAVRAEPEPIRPFRDQHRQTSYSLPFKRRLITSGLR